jgi:hypothetical protein
MIYHNSWRLRFLFGLTYDELPVGRTMAKLKREAKA